MFDEQLPTVSPGDGTRDEWAGLCLSIAESGWHAWEATAEYLATTTLDDDDLLAVGRFGQGLCGFSYEPALNYFRGVNHASPDTPTREQIERHGLEVKKAYPSATGLIAAYFKSAFQLLETRTRQDLAAWSELVLHVLDQGRPAVERVLAASEQDIAWQLVSDVSTQSLASGYQVLDEYPTLITRMGDEELAQWHGLLAHFSASDDDLGSLLEALKQVRVDPAIRPLMWRFDSPVLATFVIQHQDQLPVTNVKLMEAWITGGLDLESDAARQAFFNLESNQSINLLEKLRGQVNLIDIKRILQMFAEAMAGRRVLIDEIESGEAEAVVQFDGYRIQLPESVNAYEEEQDNFAFYKLMVLHQLGYLEFGFFDHANAIKRTLSAYRRPLLAGRLFAWLEQARIDWQLAIRFPGLEDTLDRARQQALAIRDTPADLIEAIVQLGLNAPTDTARYLAETMAPLRKPGASVLDTLACLETIYPTAEQELVSRQPPPVAYRGEIDLAQAFVAAELSEYTETLDIGEEEELLDLLSQIDPDEAEIEEIRKGQIDPDQGRLVTDLDTSGLEIGEDEDDSDAFQPLKDLKQLSAAVSRQVREDRRYYYDEWDYLIDDYRRRWCTLKEIRNSDEDAPYVEATLRDHPELLRRVRRQLNMLRPELLRKVKGVFDGEEMDLERAVEAMVDRRMRITPAENIYVERQRKERDVAALFLLDMSASTDDRIPDPDAEPVVIDEDDDDFLANYFSQQAEDDRDRIIDLEKQAVILMAEALEELGDTYAVCGFSGYGREAVEYYCCKDFDERFDLRSRGRIGGIKSARSTRMGPAIRHAARSLVKTEARIKALIVISDGYPQDHDYGKDRSSKEYGVRDTMKALSEARQQGVQSFCLTVDPSGHDYLREMCPDRQYMVIQDIKQLPDELSKVYRSLTG